MIRKCNTCDKKITPESVDKRWMYESGVCSYKCERQRKRQQREKWRKKNICRDCFDELPDRWDYSRCPECLEKNRNYQFENIWATDAEIRNGLHTDMVENKLDLED